MGPSHGLILSTETKEREEGGRQTGGGKVSSPQTFLKCSTTLAIRGMQINTALWVHFTAVRMAIIKQTKTKNASKEIGERDLHSLLVGM